MARNKVIRSREGIVLGTRTVITEELKTELLSDSRIRTQQWLKEKYHIDRQTIRKIIKDNPFPTTVKIEVREDLDPLKRTELLAKDSTKLLETTIYSMQMLLDAEIKAKKEDPTVKSTITVKDLKDFY